MNPRVRVAVKLAAFAFALFFIFFFVVNGFRYEGDAGFMSKNSFYQARFRDEGILEFDNHPYGSVDHKVQLFNVEVGCYDVVVRGETYKTCMKADNVTSDVFVHYKGLTGYTENVLSPCAPVQRQERGEYSVGGQTYAKPIQSVFIARDIPFIHIDNTLTACTPDYLLCRNVMPLVGEVVCSVKEGLVYNSGGVLFLAELE